MRNFVDPWASILDDKGKFLCGRITFYEAGNTTQLKEIFNTEGIPLPNPIYTDAFGKTMNQVLLDDADYTIVFERYVGDGNMENDDREDVWFNFKTVLSKNGDFANVLSGQNILSLQSIAELKALGNMNDGDVVQVLGYFEPGDSGEPRYYIWHDSGNATDDGGVTIKSSSTNTGYWRMIIPGTYIDVRWYGDIPDTSYNPATPTSNLGQRAKAAAAANVFKKDLYFGAHKNGGTSYYIFDGSNTVSVQKDIICDGGLRFVVRHGTTGTTISCHELHKCDRYLFISDSTTDQIGSYTLIADWIKASWMKSYTTLSTAREGYILDEMNTPLTIADAKIKLENSPLGGTVLTNCQVVEGYKVITNSITMNNIEIDTDWFADNYDWSNLTISGCRILLHNCKDANTYILLKNKQHEADYGDLGEQSINADVLAGGTIENCYGTARFISHGNVEMHNASLTVSGLSSNDSLNAVDSWLTFTADTTLASLQLRRGSLVGSATLVLIGDSLIENATINTGINSTGAALTIRNSDIHGLVVSRNLKLINNQIYNVVEQLNYGTTINVLVSGNMFHDNGVHYVHSDAAGTKVVGIWTHNGSTYSDKHWILLDRTNLLYEDLDHKYTYSGNSEPYLEKWSGRNRPMWFKRYSGHWSRNASGTGIFATMDIPFVFCNDRELTITVVPRQNYWKMFTVGRGLLGRTGHIKAGVSDGRVGILEDDYNDHTNGMIAPLWTWGCKGYQVWKADAHGGEFQDLPDDQRYVAGAAQCVSRDGSGIANYDCSFEAQLTVHGEYSYGMEIGSFPSHQWNGAQGGTGGSYQGSLNDSWVKYPATAYKICLFVFIDKDFSTDTQYILY